MSPAATPTLADQIAHLTVPPHMLALWALGQAGFVIKSADTLLVIDPYLSDSVQAGGGPARRFPPPAAPDQIKDVDLIVCTHEHQDHLDPHTLAPLLHTSPDARLVVSPQSVAILEEAQIRPTDLRVPVLGQPDQIKGVRYTALPAAHYALEVDDANRSRWMGFLIECNGVTLVHAGDTLDIPELRQALHGVAIDLLLLPINGRDAGREADGLVGNLLPREASALADALGAKVLIGMHNDLFASNRLNPAELWDDLDRRFPWQRCHLLQPGELYLYAG